MNIVLIGYRGSGKTVVGQKLAKCLDCDLISMDEEIIKLAGKSIPEIVEESGWEHFRDLESQVVKEVSKRDRCIIDAGGGVVLREENMVALGENGKVVWLQADIPAIQKRIKHDDQRPSLTSSKSFIDEVEDVLAERTPLYDRSADAIIDTSEEPVKKVVDRIYNLCKEAFHK